MVVLASPTAYVSLLLAAPRARVVLSADAFASATWPTLQQELDALPVFTVANAQGQPLQYEVGGKQSAMFYADIGAATAECEKAREEYPELEVDLIPVGLGLAYKLQVAGEAQLIPGLQELRAAGAPDDLDEQRAMLQQLPLFACLEMSQQIDGRTVLPLFVSWRDCRAAVDAATEADTPSEPLEIVGLSLPGVVQKLCTLPESEAPAFTFVPPSSSLDYIKDYLGTPQPITP